MNTTFFPARREGFARVLALAGLVAGGYVIDHATAAQPRMVNALTAPRTARSELQIATRNQGGHPPIAIRRIDEAINQVRPGMAAAGG